MCNAEEEVCPLSREGRYKKSAVVFAWGDWAYVFFSFSCMCVGGGSISTTKLQSIKIIVRSVTGNIRVRDCID